MRQNLSVVLALHREDVLLNENSQKQICKKIALLADMIYIPEYLRLVITLI